MTKSGNDYENIARMDFIQSYRDSKTQFVKIPYYSTCLRVLEYIVFKAGSIF